MNKKQKKPLTNSNRNIGNPNRYFVWLSILIGGIVIGLAVSSFNTQKPANIPVANEYSYETMNIAKQFNCSCGSCGEKELIVCTCPTAIKTKQFIEESLKKGLSTDDVSDIVNMTFGHQKG